jgi:hypothetical protein
MLAVVEVIVLVVAVLNAPDRSLAIGVASEMATAVTPVVVSERAAVPVKPVDVKDDAAVRSVPVVCVSVIVVPVPVAV